MEPMKTERTRRRRRLTDLDLVLAVNRAKRRNRARTTKRDGWERELWDAYLVDARRGFRGAANDPLDDIA